MSLSPEEKAWEKYSKLYVPGQITPAFRGMFIAGFTVGEKAGQRAARVEVATWLDKDKFASLSELHIYLDKLEAEKEPPDAEH